MVGDPAQVAPTVFNWPEDAPPDIASMPPLPALMEAEWTAYAVKTVLAWRKRPFRLSDEPEKDAK